MQTAILIRFSFVWKKAGEGERWGVGEEKEWGGEGKQPLSPQRSWGPHMGPGLPVGTGLLVVLEV